MSKGIKALALKGCICRSNEERAGEAQYFPLVPVSSVSDADGYFRALEKVLGDNAIRNIAITGKYGSGKSSVLRTFFHHKIPFLSIPERWKRWRIGRPLWVSVAAFESLGGSKISSQELELWLLEQILFAEKGSRVPIPRLGRIREKDWVRQLWVWLVWLALAVSWMVFFWQPSLTNRFSEIVSKFSEIGWWKPEWTLHVTAFFLCIGVLSLIQVSWWLYRVFQKKWVGISLKLGMVCVDTKEMGGDSALNKHLEELIYFFSVTKHRIVVFEDIDRLSDKSLFIKLRTLNTILNVSCQSRFCQKPIKFIYAVRDDIFSTTEERVKFFDFIIPIVPILGCGMVNELVGRLLHDAGLTNDEIDQCAMTIESVAPFLSDRRIVHAICNEFLIMRELFKGKGSVTRDLLRDDKIMAMAIFKSFLPAEYAKLTDSDNIIEQFLRFNERDIRTQRKAISRKIAKIQKKIQEKKDRSEEEIANLGNEENRLQTTLSALSERSLTEFARTGNMWSGYQNVPEVVRRLFEDGLITRDYRMYVTCPHPYNFKDYPYIMKLLQGDFAFEYKVDDEENVILKLQEQKFPMNKVVNSSIWSWLIEKTAEAFREVEKASDGVQKIEAQRVYDRYARLVGQVFGLVGQVFGESGVPTTSIKYWQILLQQKRTDGKFCRDFVWFHTWFQMHLHDNVLKEYGLKDAERITFFCLLYRIIARYGSPLEIERQHWDVLCKCEDVGTMLKDLGAERRVIVAAMYSGIKFLNCHYDGSREPYRGFTDDLISYRSYELTVKSIEQVLKLKGISCADWNSQLLTVIAEIPQLGEYVKDSFDSFSRDVYSKLPPQRDGEAVLIPYLANGSISEKAKEILIEKHPVLTITYEKIKDLPNDIIRLLWRCKVCKLPEEKEKEFLGEGLTRDSLLRDLMTGE